MADGGIAGRCHCGEATVTIPRKPDKIAHCNCSLCTAVGWRGVYFPPEEVTIDGNFDCYRRSDIKQPMIDLFRCKRCGMATHWTLLSEPPHERIGINAHLFEHEFLAGVEVIKADGRNWER